MGHEVAHLLANHSQERMHSDAFWSRLLLPWTPVFLIGGALTGLGVFGAFIDEVALLLSIPGLVLLSPLVAWQKRRMYEFRVQEDEADYIGLLLMTEAGYEPQAAVEVMDKLDKHVAQLTERLKRQFGHDKVEVKKEWQLTHPHVSG